jgi:signal transduction histidine kinase
MESGAPVLDEAEMGLDALVAPCIEQIYAQGVGALAIVNRIAPDAPAWVVDRAQIREAIQNLLSNAVKFTPDGGTVTIESLPAADGGATLVITDTGIGIPPADRTRVFEPFVQLDSALNRPMTASASA